MEVKNYFATDSAGNILGSAQVYVYLAGTTTLATGLQNISGASISNPFTAQANGLVQFQAPDNDYDMRVVKLGRDFTIRIQCFDGVAFLKNPGSYIGADDLSYRPAGSSDTEISIQQAIISYAVNVMHFGAAGIGGDDTTSIKSAMNYALSSGKALYFPGALGSYGLTEELFAQDKSLSIIGDGSGLSKIYVDHAGIGFRYSSADRTKNLSLKGLQINASNVGAVSGLDITFPVTSAVDQSQLTLEDVEIRTVGTGTWNYSCVRLQGVKNPFLRNVIARGNIANTLYGVSLEGQTIDADLDCVRCYLVGSGINIIGANEGTTIRGYTAVSVKVGIDINPDNSGPWISISNFHINSSEFGIRCNRRTQVEIDNGLLYANNLFGSTQWTGISFAHNAGSFAEYCNVRGVVFNRQNFANPTVGIQYANSRYCQATGCSFVNIAQPFVEDSTSTMNLRLFNTYAGISNPVTKNGLAGGETFRVSTSVFAQNRLVAAGALTGSSPSISAEGVDAVIGLEINAKGANAPVSVGSVGAGVGFQVLTPASTVNRPRAVGAVAGNPATIDATGADTLIWLALRGKGAAGIMLPATVSANYASDAAAATAGVPISGVYHTDGALKIRRT